MNTFVKRETKRVVVYDVVTKVGEITRITQEDFNKLIVQLNDENIQFVLLGEDRWVNKEMILEIEGVEVSELGN